MDRFPSPICLYNPTFDGVRAESVSAISSPKRRWRVLKTKTTRDWRNVPDIWTHIKCQLQTSRRLLPSLSWVSAWKQTSGWTSLALIVHPHERNPEWDQRCVGEWVCSKHAWVDMYCTNENHELFFYAIDYMDTSQFLHGTWVEGFSDGNYWIWTAKVGQTSAFNSPKEE